MTEREKAELVAELEDLLAKVKADEIISYILTWDDGERAKMALGGPHVSAMALSLLKAALSRVLP